MPFVTEITNWNVPDAVGVPAIVVVAFALDVSSERPSGNVPEATDHVKGPEAPFAVKSSL